MLKAVRGKLRYDWRKGSSVLLGNYILYFLLANRNLFKGILLDLGCGSRPYGILYDREVDLWVASDLPKTKQGFNGNVISIGESLPFKSNSFDVVLCTEVIMHVDNPFAALDEISRVVKEDGDLILTGTFLYPVNEIPRDNWRFSFFGLEKALRKSGLKPKLVLAKGGLMTMMAVFTLVSFVSLASLVGKRIGIDPLKCKVLRLMVALPQVVIWAIIKPLVISKLRRLSRAPSHYESIFSMGYCIVAGKVQGNKD